MEFPQFAAGVFKGLGQAVTTDIDVFLLTCTGVLWGSKYRRPRALGTALGAYLVFRRADLYMDLVNSKLTMIARVMADNGRQPAVQINAPSAASPEGV